MLTILFPSQPFSREIDSDFEAEQLAAKPAGFSTYLIDHTKLISGDIISAISQVPNNERAGLYDIALYRGWMLKSEQYNAMYTQLKNRGIVLINTPEQYKTCHYLPESYQFIKNHTPRSVWLPINGEIDFEKIYLILSSFGNNAIIIKDYVKSQKHYWTEACFIPDASDKHTVQRVVNKFIELQGDDLNEGLVFREYVPLKHIGTHPKSGMPLTAEFRIFYLDTKPILSYRYWGDLVSFNKEIPYMELQHIVENIPSRFFTIDIAFTDDAGWIIVELGDGQVSGLPSNNLAPEFFKQLSVL